MHRHKHQYDDGTTVKYESCVGCVAESKEVPDLEHSSPSGAMVSLCHVDKDEHENSPIASISGS